jgi:hypothetical protein
MQGCNEERLLAAFRTMSPGDREMLLILAQMFADQESGKKPPVRPNSDNDN